jgi:hypothetical protein
LKKYPQPTSLFFLLEQKETKIQVKTMPRALSFFKIRNQKSTKALLGSSKKRKFTAHPPPRFDRPSRFPFGIL